MIGKLTFIKIKASIKFIIAILIIFFAVGLIKYSKEVSSAVILSIESCLKIIIPSLFAFMVLSNLIVKSNIYILISKPFSLISRYLFRIPPELFSIFLLSNIGGYPIGAKLLTELVQQGKLDKEVAENMLCYCYCNSPSFFAGAVGVVIFDNVLVGLIAYFSIVITNFILAIIIGQKNKIPPRKKINPNIKLSADMLIDSIISASKTLFVICVMLVFFAAFIAILDATGIISILTVKIMSLINSDYNTSLSAIMSFIEISKISTMSKYCYNYLPLMTALASFGGLCVITQIIGITSNKISLKKFAISRPLHIAISYLICYYLIKCFIKHITISTFYAYDVIYYKKTSIIPSLCIIIMVIILLLDKNNRFYEEGVL